MREAREREEAERVAPEETATLVAEPHAGPMVMRGREMDGWLRVAAEGVATKRQLERWVARGVAYARTLPPKSAAKKRRAPRTA